MGFPLSTTRYSAPASFPTLFIDLIVFFDEDTPLNLIEAIRPDVLVKGGDYTPDTVVGRDVVESYGGKVAICPRLEGLSTTDLVRKIKDE